MIQLLVCPPKPLLQLRPTLVLFFLLNVAFQESYEPSLGHMAPYQTKLQGSRFLQGQVQFVAPLFVAQTILMSPVIDQTLLASQTETAHTKKHMIKQTQNALKSDLPLLQFGPKMEIQTNLKQSLTPTPLSSTHAATSKMYWMCFDAKMSSLLA